MQPNSTIGGLEILIIMMIPRKTFPNTSWQQPNKTLRGINLVFKLGSVLHYLQQYGAVPKSSTTQALLHTDHCWAKETDGNGATVRTILI